MQAAATGPRCWRNIQDESAAMPALFGQARALATLGSTPLVVTAAGHVADPGWAVCAGPDGRAVDQLEEAVPMTALTARADVPTAAPARYAKQLLSHLGRRVTWATDGDTSTAELAGGTGTVIVGDGVITLLAQAPDAEALARVQHVLGSHLERFGQRNELQVSWNRP